VPNYTLLIICKLLLIVFAKEHYIHKLLKPSYKQELSSACFFSLQLEKVRNSPVLVHDEIVRKVSARARNLCK